MTSATLPAVAAGQSSKEPVVRSGRILLYVVLTVGAVLMITPLSAAGGLAVHKKAKAAGIPVIDYDRVTLGFRGMPSFSHEFSEEERRAVAAYILSREFSN